MLRMLSFFNSHSTFEGVRNLLCSFPLFSFLLSCLPPVSSSSVRKRKACPAASPRDLTRKMPESSNAHGDEQDFLEAAPAEISQALSKIWTTFSAIEFRLSRHYPSSWFRNTEYVLLQMVSTMGGRTAEPLTTRNAHVKRLLPRVDFEELRALVVEFADDPMDPTQFFTLKRVKPSRLLLEHGSSSSLIRNFISRQVTWKFHDSEEVNLKMYSSLAVGSLTTSRKSLAGGAQRVLLGSCTQVFEQLLKLRELMCATQSTDRYNFSVQECVHFDKRGWGSVERLLYCSVLASFWDPATLDAQKQYDVLDELSQLYQEVDRKGYPPSMVTVRLKIDYDKWVR